MILSFFPQPSSLVTRAHVPFLQDIDDVNALYAGILEGDLLIVDRAIEPLNNHIVIASINDEQTVKRLRVRKGTVSLVPENVNYKPIEITG
ncbi:MAG: hypothetical protein HGB01_06315 [Chlorobiaceae bacterium]|nr:hypothetical protein [Chlorobiaceae bacterium]